MRSFLVFIFPSCYNGNRKGGVFVYLINKSVIITENLKQNLAITDQAVVDIQAEYNGDIHLWNGSRVILRHDLHGTVNASGNSVVEYYATIHNGLFTSGDSGVQYARPMSPSSYVIGCTVETAKKNAETHRKLQSGEITPPLHPACKTE